MLQRETERLLRAFDVADLGQCDTQASGEPHVPVRDEPGQEVDGAVPVAVVEVGPGQQVVRAGLGGGDGMPQDVDGLVGPAGLEQRGAGRGQPAQGGGRGGGHLGQRGAGQGVGRCSGHRDPHLSPE